MLKADSHDMQHGLDEGGVAGASEHNLPGLRVETALYTVADEYGITLDRSRAGRLASLAEHRTFSKKGIYSDNHGLIIAPVSISEAWTPIIDSMGV